jgi:hypothetical protein
MESIKEKAKAYDKAIERAKEIMECSKNSDSKEVRMVLSFFPELAGSEDERIRKIMIEHFKNKPEQYTFGGLTNAEVVSWLEKQGEHKSAEWSEEDEVKINRIVACLENLNVADNDILLKDIDWLKSLKERIGG